MQKLTVHEGNQNEWEIAYYLFGNTKSKNLVFMIHGGGMDSRESAPYLSEILYDEFGNRSKTFAQIEQGNYEKLTNSILKTNSDTLICRIDLRNHGESLVDGKMDTRNTSLHLLADDTAEVLRYVKTKYDIAQIEIVGTCMGCLVTEYMLTNSKNQDLYESVLAVVFNSPLSTQFLAFPMPSEKFNFNKYQLLMNSPDGTQFTKMKGVFDSKPTIEELMQRPNLHKEFASLNIPTQIFLGYGDRLLPYKRAKQLADEMKQVNPSIEIIKVSRSPEKVIDQDTIIRKMISKDANHCLYDPKSSYKFISKATDFLLPYITASKEQNV